jgi:hypothetical protein
MTIINESLELDVIFLTRERRGVSSPYINRTKTTESVFFTDSVATVTVFFVKGPAADATEAPQP